MKRLMSFPPGLLPPVCFEHFPLKSVRALIVHPRLKQRRCCTRTRRHVSTRKDHERLAAGLAYRLQWQPSTTVRGALILLCGIEFVADQCANLKQPFDLRLHQGRFSLFHSVKCSSKTWSRELDALHKKIRQLEVAAHLGDWLSSPGLRPPKTQDQVP